MKEKLLIALFAFLLFAESLGLDVNLAPGLSMKNALLYGLLVAIIIEATVSATEFRFSFVSLHSIFVLLIAYAGASWAISAVGYSKVDYPVVNSFMSLKATLVDRYLILLVYLYALKSREQVLYVVRALVWLVIISSFITLIDLLNIPNLGIIEDPVDGRVQGPAGQPNEYGGFLAFWIPACIGIYLTSHGRRRIFIGVGILVSIGMLILTGSRGGMLATIAGSMIAVVMLRRYLPFVGIMRGTVVALVATISVGLVASLEFSEVIEERVEQTTADDVHTISAGRIVIWSEALSRMNKNPESYVYGNGWMSFRFFADTSAHNTYLRMFFELGAIGLILYVMLFFVPIHLFRSGLQWAQGTSRTYLIAVIFALCTVVVTTVFSELHRSWMMIWAYVGLMLRLTFIEHSNAKKKQPTI